MKQRITAAAFNPSAKTVSFANISGFNVAGLLAIIDGSNVLYVAGTPALALAGVSGSTVTLNAGVSTSGETSADALTIFYDDGMSPASAALQPALNADGGALAHVTNFPSSQAVSGTFWQALQPVSLAALPALPAGSNTIGAISNTSFAASQSGAWSVSISNLPSTQPVSAASLPLPAGAAAAALQPALNADGGALAHVTNWPSSQAVTGAFFQTTQPVSLAALPALPAGSNVIGGVTQSGGPWSVSWAGQSVGVSSLPALPAGSNAIGSVSVSALPALAAGSNAIGSVSVSNFPSTQTVAGSVAVSNFPATQAVSAASLPLPAGAATAASQASILAALQGSLGVSDAQSAPFAGAVAMTPGTIYPAGRSVGVLCTIAGAVEIQFPDTSTLTLPVGIGWQTFPFAVTQIIAAGTTASSTCYNLK